MSENVLVLADDSGWYRAQSKKRRDNEEIIIHPYELYLHLLLADKKELANSSLSYSDSISVSAN